MATELEYALMAGAAYVSTRDRENRIAPPSGFALLGGPRTTAATGFEAQAYVRGNEIVISFAGTGSWQDWIANIQLAGGASTSQLNEAALYYEEIKAAYGAGRTISFAGHSLGGGFLALAAYDQNADGKITAADPLYMSLRVWRDANLNGESESWELSSLADLKVASIGTGWSDSTLVDAAGNAHRQVGSFTMNGQTRTASDVWFAVNRTRTAELDHRPIPADIEALPQAKGFGEMHDLRQGHTAKVRHSHAEFRCRNLFPRTLREQSSASCRIHARNSKPPILIDLRSGIRHLYSGRATAALRRIANSVRTRSGASVSYAAARL